MYDFVINKNTFIYTFVLIDFLCKTSYIYWLIFKKRHLQIINNNIFHWIFTWWFLMYFEVAILMIWQMAKHFVIYNTLSAGKPGVWLSHLHMTRMGLSTLNQYRSTYNLIYIADMWKLLPIIILNAWLTELLV